MKHWWKRQYYLLFYRGSCLKLQFQNKAIYETDEVLITAFGKLKSLGRDWFMKVK